MGSQIRGLLARMSGSRDREVVLKPFFRKKFTFQNMVTKTTSSAPLLRAISTQYSTSAEPIPCRLLLFSMAKLCKIEVVLSKSSAQHPSRQFSKDARATISARQPSTTPIRADSKKWSICGNSSGVAIDINRPTTETSLAKASLARNSANRSLNRG